MNKVVEQTEIMGSDNPNLGIKGKRERNKAANRAAIMAAAMSCFTELGYESVTVRDIIRKTSLASGTFYNYFRDKDEIFRALLEEHMSAMTARTHEARQSAQNLEQFLKQSFLAAFTMIVEDPIFYKLVMRNEAVIREHYEDRILGVSMASLIEDVEDAQRRGIIPPESSGMDVEYLSAAFFGVAYEMGRVLSRKPQPDPEAAAQLACHFFLNGIGTI